MQMSHIAIDPDARRASPEIFKSAMRTLMGGVCVVTTRHGDDVIGVTVTAACSVSAEEPLILICLNRSGRVAAPIAEQARFGLSVLSANQRSAAQYFARSGEACEPHFVWDNDCPTIDGALARLVCVSQHQVHAGTHLILVALVENATVVAGQPLGYANGSYCTVAKLLEDVNPG